jgi:hypothetical protein
MTRTGIAALIDGFRLRGIRPEGAMSYSEEALRWSAPEEFTGQPAPPRKGLTFKILEQPTREDLADTARALSIYGTTNAEILGLTPGVPVQSHKFHLVHRVDPDGQLELEMMAELVQQRQVRLDPDDPASPTFTARGARRFCWTTWEMCATRSTNTSAMTRPPTPVYSSSERTLANCAHRRRLPRNC